MPLPDGVFEAHCRPDRITDRKADRTARDKARLATAGLAKDAADLKCMLDMLSLWPDSDDEHVREVYLIDRRDAEIRRK